MSPSEALVGLKRLNLSSYPIDEIYRLLSSLRKVGLLVKTFSPGEHIFRMRKGWGWYHQSQLTYRDAEECDKVQRASNIGHTMFYGMISYDQNPLAGAGYIGLSECITMTDGKINYESGQYTMGEWMVMRPITLVCFIHPDKYLYKNNPLLNELLYAYESLKINNKYFDDVQSFICDEFSKQVDRDNEDYKYLISALFTEKITEKRSVDGIMYPSIRTTGIGGINVAIKPSIIDEKALMLLKIHDMEVVNTSKGIKVVDRKIIEYPNLHICYRNNESYGTIYE